MTKLFTTITVFFLTQFAYGQTYAWVSSYYYSYVEISVEYTQKVAEHKITYGQILATKQAQYDAAHREVSAVYGRMLNLNLLNKTNRDYLNAYRDKYFKYIADQAAKLDLAISENKTWAINNFQMPVSSNKYIRNEIKILSKLGKEIDFIEHEAYKFPKEQVGDIEQKKKNISGFLTEYETIDPSQTQTLLKKYDLHLMMISEFLEN
jgi:hypothetical protein